MTAESDNVGSISVDVGLNLTPFRQGMEAIETALSHLAESERTVPLNIPKLPEAEVKRWERLAAATAKMQQAPVSGGPSAAAPSGGGSAGMSHVAFSDQDANAFGTKIAAAVEHALQNLTVNLQIGNLEDIKRELGSVQIHELKVGQVVSQGGGAVHMAAAQAVPGSVTDQSRSLILSQMRSSLEKSGAGGEVHAAVEKLNTKLKAENQHLVEVFDDAADQLVAIYERFGAKTQQELAQASPKVRGVRPTIVGGALAPLAASDTQLSRTLLGVLNKTSANGIPTQIAQLMTMGRAHTGAPVPVNIVQQSAPAPAAATPTAELQKAAVVQRQEQTQPARDPGNNAVNVAARPGQTLRELVDEAQRLNRTPAALRSGPRTINPSEIGNSGGTGPAIGPRTPGTREVRRGERYLDAEGVARMRYTDARGRPTDDPLLAKPNISLGGRSPFLYGQINEQGINLSGLARSVLRGTFANKAYGGLPGEESYVDVPVDPDTGKADRLPHSGGSIAGRKGVFKPVSESQLVYRALRELGVSAERATVATGKEGIFTEIGRARNRGTLRSPLGISGSGDPDSVARAARDLVHGQSILKRLEHNLALAEGRISQVQESRIIGETDKRGRAIPSRPGTLYFTSEELRQESLDQAKHARQMAQERLQQGQSKFSRGQLRYVAESVGGAENRAAIEKDLGMREDRLQGPTLSGAPLERTLRPEDRETITASKNASAQFPAIAKTDDWVNRIFDDLLSGKLPIESNTDKVIREGTARALAANPNEKYPVPIIQAMPDEHGKMVQRQLSVAEWEEQKKKNPQFTARSALRERLYDTVESLYDQAGLTGRDRSLRKLDDMGFTEITPAVQALFGHQKNFEDFSEANRQRLRAADTRAAGLTSTSHGTRQNPRGRVLANPGMGQQTNVSPEFLAKRDQQQLDIDAMEGKEPPASLSAERRQRYNALRERYAGYGFSSVQAGISVNKGSAAGSYELPSDASFAHRGHGRYEKLSSTGEGTGEFFNVNALRHRQQAVQAAREQLRAMDKVIKNNTRTFRTTTGDVPDLSTGDDERRAGMVVPPGGLPAPTAAETLGSRAAKTAAMHRIHEEALADDENRISNGGGGIFGSGGLPTTVSDGGHGPIHVIIDAPLPIPVRIEGSGGGDNSIAGGGGHGGGLSPFRSANLDLAATRRAGLKNGEISNEGSALRVGRKALSQGWTVPETAEMLKQWYGPGVAGRTSRIFQEEEMGRQIQAAYDSGDTEEGQRLQKQLEGFRATGKMPPTPAASSGGGGGAKGKPSKRIQYMPNPMKTGGWNMRYQQNIRAVVSPQQREAERQAAEAEKARQIAIAPNMRSVRTAQQVGMERDARDAEKARVQQIRDAGFTFKNGLGELPPFNNLRSQRRAEEAAGPFDPANPQITNPKLASLYGVPAYEEPSVAGPASASSYQRLRRRLAAVGINVQQPLPTRRASSFGGPDEAAALVSAEIRRQQGQLGQRAFGPTVTSAVMNRLSPIFSRERTVDVPSQFQGVLGGPQLTLPADPFARLGLVRREESEAQRLRSRAENTQRQLSDITAQRQSLVSALQGQFRGAPPERRAELLNTPAIRETIATIGNLGKSAKTTSQALAADTKAASEHAAASAFVAKEATGLGDVLGNLALGFVGGAAAGIIAPIATGAGTAALGVIKEVLDPAYEAAIGYQNVTNKVIGALSDQVLAAHGATAQTVAQTAAAKGLTYSQYQQYHAGLEQASQVEAGNKAYGDYIDLVRSARNVSQGGEPRGLYHATGGLNLLGLQTPLGGTPSTLENVINSFNGVQRTFAGVPVSHQDLPGQLGDVLFQDIGGVATHLTDITGYAKSLADSSVKLRADTIKDWNAQLDKSNHGYKVAVDYSDAARKSLEKLADTYGVAPADIANLTKIGFAIHDAAGNVVTDVAALNQAFDDLASGPLKIDWKTQLSQLLTPTGGLTLQLDQMRRQGDLQRQTAYSNQFLQELGTPTTPYGRGVADVPGLAGAYGPAYAQLSPYANYARSITARYQAQGAQSTMDDLLHGGLTQPQQQQGLTDLSTLSELGKQYDALVRKQQAITGGQMWRNYTHDVSIATRQLGDLVGLAGKASVNVPGVGNVGASNVGTMQRQDFELSRDIQLIGFRQQQRALNYQTALAGFSAEGSTGEERAARAEIAAKQVAVQQTILDKSKTIAGNEYQINTTGFQRQLDDASFGLSNMVTTFSENGKLGAINDALEKNRAAVSATTTDLSALRDQGVAYKGMIIDTGEQLLALGADAVALGKNFENLSKMIEDQTGVTPQAAANQDNGHYDSGLGMWVPGPAPTTTTNTDAQTTTDESHMLPPEFFPPGTAPGSGKAGGGAGLIDPYLTATPMGERGATTVQIVNPSAGVDTQSLVRVVVTELNRQAGLRGLSTVGGR